ncbi:MAG: ribonuclease R [Ignavibacteria bacterium GWB2_36_8]|nr:MAG: ribonuclease R [Ignavibacteria bacterium GWB2_36_8]OGU50084.1 MAG: ribonuclease R [Ignavibacteria bacterium GWC2_36_12]OGV09950.1 MAG: ribonuclease R [Ignavibacteria bacterium RIFOXYB2_FULL_36_7]
MKKKIIAFFKKNPGKSFKNKDIANRLKIISEHEYSALKSALHKLYEENFLAKNGKRFKLNTIPADNRITGKLEINQGGYGFVIPGSKEIGDIFIAARNLSTAFSGDTVEVALFAKQKRKNFEGQIIKVIKRKREEIVGTLKKSNSFYFVKPDDPGIHRDIYIDISHLKGAKKGDKVIVSNLFWNTSMLNPEAEIIEVIGESGLEETEAIAIAREFNLPYKFPDKVIAEADKIESEISPDEINRRVDFRHENVFTIDPEDAKDFDDALSVKELENGNYLIGIHIADVSHYVKNNTQLDKNALKRGNSVYFVGQVIPMLPEKLSNNLCSLVLAKDRLTYSVIVELTQRGKIVKYDIKKSVINSKRRFTYDEVQEIIETKKGDFAKEIICLNNIARVLRKKRFREGGIEFFTPEIKFRLDDEGKPTEIFKKEIKESNMLVEEFMLFANKTVAHHIGSPEKTARPFIYRIHDLPDKEKIYEFARFLKSLGYTFDPNSASQTLQFMNLMEQIKNTEEEALINELAIRSMAKAIYSVNNIGHYGLGFKYYTHFTSPIRRYSDLIVHRLLYNYIEGNGAANYPLVKLEEISEHISQCERNAIEAERLSVKLKQIDYLKEHLGEEFNAIISGIAHFGIFVKITDNLAEGLVRLRDLEGDFYVYDEKKYALIGRVSKKQFRLGDKVKVKLVRVDTDKTELDFIISNE